MPPSRNTEPIDVFEDGNLSLNGFEERLDCGVIIAASFTAHQNFETMATQELFIIMRAVLATAACVMAAFRRR